MNKTMMGIVVLLAVVFAGPAAAQEVKGPKIAVKEISHDFGKVTQGTQASHVFEVSNAGTEPLIIERVQTS
jgi:uncharacterized membrane protein